MRILFNYCSVLVVNPITSRPHTESISFRSTVYKTNLRQFSLHSSNTIELIDNKKNWSKFTLHMKLAISPQCIDLYVCVCILVSLFFVCVFKHWLSLTLGGRDDKSFPHDSLQWIGYDFYLFSEAWWWWWRPWRRLRHDAPVAFTHKLKRRRRKKKRSRDRLKKAFTSDCQHFYYAISFIYILDYKPHPPSSSQSHFFFFSIINSSFFFLFKFAEFEYEFTPTPDGVVSRVRRAH